MMCIKTSKGAFYFDHRISNMRYYETEAAKERRSLAELSDTQLNFHRDGGMGFKQQLRPQLPYLMIWSNVNQHSSRSLPLQHSLLPSTNRNPPPQDSRKAHLNSW